MKRSNAPPTRALRCITHRRARPAGGWPPLNGWVSTWKVATLREPVVPRPATSACEADMRALASGALRTLGGLRAKSSAADLARRLAAPLTESQRALLVEWGCPYVFDEFRSHMTLSSSLDAADERSALVAWWQQRITQLGVLVVDNAALFVEPAPWPVLGAVAAFTVSEC